MTTCKHCGERIVKYGNLWVAPEWNGSYWCKSDRVAGRHKPAEPAATTGAQMAAEPPPTEGTQPEQTVTIPTGSWGNSIVLHISPEHKTAQVDAPMKHDGSEHFYAENYGRSVGHNEPAVAQTELPYVPQAELKIPDDLKADYHDALISAYFAYNGSKVRHMIERIAKSEARQAESKAEIGAKDEELSLWRSEHDPCPFQLRMEALERSHKVLLDWVNNTGHLTNCKFRESLCSQPGCAEIHTTPCTCGRDANIAAGEKL